MKKNLKKLLSLLTALTIFFTMAGIPAMAEDVAVDFTAAENLAYGMNMNAIAGKNYYAKNSTAPKAGAQYGTDGDITTYHLAATRTGISWGTRVGSEVNLDLGDTKNITKVTVYAQPTMNDGSNDRSNANLTINVYGGSSSAAGTAIGSMTNQGSKTVSDGTNSLEVYVYDIEFPADSVYQYITFDCNSGYFWGWNEIYVEGATATVADADKVAADKAALALGDTSALTANLTLPTAGAAYGSAITWETSDAAVIAADGVINRVGEDKTATLTATITNGAVSGTKEFEVTVKGLTLHTVDLSAENNILLGKTVTPIVGYYYSNSDPSDTKQFATDGDLTTGHSGYGKVSGQTVGVAFSIDLEDEYTIDNLDIILAKGEHSRAVSIYNGTAVDESKLIGTYNGATEAYYVTAGSQEGAHAVISCDLPDNTVASQLTIAYAGGYGFTYSEIVATGLKGASGGTTPEGPTDPEPDYASLVAGDKAALDLGNTSAVKADLTLPTTGSVNGSAITWATSDASVITNTGVITRGDADKTATLTATITNGTASDTKEFAVTVAKVASEPEEPIVPTKTIDFTEATNLAYGKTITHIHGHYYSSSTPSATKQFATDGDINTSHSGYGKVNSQTVGVAFYIDLGKVYKVSQIDLYLANIGEANRAYKLYKGTAVDEANYIADVPASNATSVVNGKEVVDNSFAIPGDVETQYLTLYYTGGYGFTYSELYIKGTEVSGEVTPDYAALVAGDKAALDLGNTSAVKADLTLPTTGSVNGSAITWATSDASVITNTGVITRGDEDKTATITATITNGDASDTKEFTVTVVKAAPIEMVNFTATENVAYGKTVTPIAGTYYSSGPKPSATNQKATDGDINTLHSGYGRATTASTSEKTGVVFSLDLGKEYNLENVVIYVGQSQRYAKLYSGTSVDESKLLLTTTTDNVATTVNGKENMYKLVGEFPADTKAQYITFNYPEGSGFPYYEIYIKGTEVTAPAPDYAALVAADKAALDLGNTSAVEADLTLPVTGSVNGSAITWATSDASVITNTGVITRAAEDKTATLTATITNGTASDTKEFTVTVAKIVSEPEVPTPSTKAVDFTEAANVAYGKVVTPKAGKDKYAAGTAPTETNQKATDGDIATYHLAAGRSGISWGTQVGSEFSIDLGGNKAITSVDLYVQPAINDGSMDRPTDGYAINVYGGNDAATGTLIGQMTIPTATTAVTAGGKTMDMYIYHIDFPADAVYSAVTFDKPAGYYFGYNEIYVAGTAVTTPEPDYAALVAADKAALDLGNTSAVEANLTLPTKGSVNNSTITWATSDASVITNTGVITRAAEDKTATLTATITNGTASDTKEFTVTVAKEEAPTVPIKIVDFTESANIAYGKIITPISGSYYSSGPKPSATNQRATDGDINTHHSGYGKEGSTVTGLSFSIDLGKVYKVSQIDLYLAELGQANRSYKLYKGTAVDESKLIATVPASNATAIVNGKEVAANSFVITGDVETQYLTFYYPEGYGFSCSELYIKGTEVTGGGTTPEPEPDPDPEVPASKTVNFADAANIAYGKALTPVTGSYYSSGPKPTATNQKATDGDVTTRHSGYGKEGSTVTGLTFYIDLGKTYKLDELTMYISQTDRGYKLYKGQTVDEANYIGQVQPAGATVNVNGSDLGETTFDFGDDVETQYLTFYYGSSSGLTFHEIYLTGTEVTGGGTTPEPDEPGIPDGTIDFTAAKNIAYGKTLTHINGHYYSSGLAPAANRQFATDGNVNTWHAGYGKVNSQVVGVSFYIDLGQEYELDEVALFVNPAGRGYKVYKGTSVDEANYLATGVPTGTLETVNDGTTQLDKVTATFPEGTKARYLTFYYSGGYGFSYYEMYMTGTAVGGGTTPDYAALVAGDKAALNLGNTSAVTGNLTLPTTGANGSTITWATSDASVITNAGVITSGAEDKTATLTATITNGGVSDTKEFIVTVAKKEITIVNFKTSKNLAYGKVITPKSGKDYYASSSTKPSATSQLATDGDITTWHLAAGRKNISWGDNVGAEFNLDLGKSRVIKSVYLYVQEGIHDSINSVTGEYTGNYRTQGSLNINVYGGEDSATGTLIGTMTKPTGLKTITADGKTLDMYIYRIDFPAGAEYSKITFDSTAWYFGYNEIYVEYELAGEDYTNIVASDKAALDLGNTSNVISDLTLPLVGADGSTITWATSDATVITEAGVVTRAAENKTATLTATITNGTASDTKTFEVTVLGTESAEGRVESDKAALNLGDTSAVTENLTLPTVGANGSTITWRTNNPSVIETDGTVHRDIDSNRATLTATITYGDAFETKQFTIVVLGTETDEDRVASDKETLTLGDTSAVKGNLTLPTVGAKGTAITWATSNASVITNTGVVTRGDADKTATLTATIKYGDVTATKTFTVTVPKKVDVTGTVDFASAENVAYKKVVTPVSGRNKYAQSSVAPDEEHNYTTDGDITTFHMGATRSNVSWGTTVGSEFTIDLAETFTIESVDLFTQPEMYNGYSSTPNSNKNLTIYVFGDGNKDTGTLVGKMIVPASTTVISDGTNELEVCVYHIDFPVNSHYSTLSFYSASGYFWGWNEVYVKGESSLADNVADDKKSIEFGDLNDVVESLELPTVGAKGSTITWATSDASVIETDGTVHRAEHTKKAKLTATITKGEFSDTKEFYLTVLGTYENHYVMNSDDFSDANIRYKYVSNVAADSTAAVNTTNNKLELTRGANGEVSVKKYFVTERADVPYSVIGDKVVVEQLMTVGDGLTGATAEIRNKNDEVVATYGIKKEGSDYVFFLNVGGREQSALYTYGEEIFTRVELITENGASKVVAFVGTEYGVNSVAEFPLASSVHPSMTTVKYTANEGGNGKLTLDGVKFMVEGADKDKIAVVIETENFKETNVSTQNFDEVTRNLSLKTSSIFDCQYSYESSNQSVISNEGLVIRALEDTPVTLTVTVKRGGFSKSLTYDLVVKGMASDNMAMNNLILSSGAIEGFSEKNAVDGLLDTAFITDAEEKFFTICFDKATTFNIVTLFEAKNEADEYGVTGFEIQTSENGVDWKTVYTGTTVGEQKTVEFPQVTTKYVRYYVTGLEGNQTGLSEIVLTYVPVPEVAIDLDLAGIVIRPNDYVVTSNLTLPTEGEYGSVITWKSSHPDILADDGTIVSVPEKDTLIKLTATLTNGEFTRTKDFTRSVKGSSNGSTSEETGKNEKPGGVTGGGSGGGGGAGGGGGSDKKEDPKPVDPTPVDPTPVVPSTSVFKDVENDRWSYDYILELKEAGIVNGDGENFRPTDKVTREEFVKMLVLSLGITPEGKADFSDVASDAWYHDYIAIAVDKGIVNGLSDSEFGIGRSISRQDMAVMTVRALKALEVKLQSDEAPVFTDGDAIADYATEAVETLAAAGILAGSDGKFAPADNLTREQAAKVLCMIRKELTK